MFRDSETVRRDIDRQYVQERKRDRETMSQRERE
jgi:hypothetical protein